MAHFRGYVVGTHSETSRLGSKTRGLEATAQAWGGEVHVKMWHETLGGEPRDMVRIWASNNPAQYGPSWEVAIFYGTVAELAAVVGLAGKPTATHAGDVLVPVLKELAGKLGEYPHARLNETAIEPKQTTRLLKVECPVCGYVARVTRIWLDDAGAPICPTDRLDMVEIVG